MSTEQRHEYRMTWIDDDHDAVNNQLEEWSKAGWELVSGAASHWSSKAVHEPKVVSPPLLWHTRYVMYWRRPITANAPA